MEQSTDVRSSNPLFDRVLRRSLLDLRILRSQLDGLHYFAAGVPWFVTLFGRDSAIAAIQTLPYGSGVARQTLQLLAKYQAEDHDAYRDAEPGKILHEYRTGELAQCDTIPQSPAYYGSVDSTLLFLILLAEYVNWSGDLALARQLRPHVDAALGWMDHHADHNGDGYLDYGGRYRNGLVNQGWKDSGNAIVNADGSLAEPPIALCEAQGYAYRAWRQIAALERALGEGDRAAALDRRADDLQARFERDYWSAELGCYVLALQKDGRPARVAASNAGQVLWSGIASGDHAARVAQRLMEPDMFSGWGIRTLSRDAVGFNPMSYHLGSVWPHDNGLILDGFRRYGHDKPRSACSKPCSTPARTSSTTAYRSCTAATSDATRSPTRFAIPWRAARRPGPRARCRMRCGTCSACARMPCTAACTSCARGSRTGWTGWSCGASRWARPWWICVWNEMASTRAWA